MCRAVFGLAALFPLVVSYSALLINDQKIVSVSSSGGKGWAWWRETGGQKRAAGGLELGERRLGGPWAEQGEWTR